MSSAARPRIGRSYTRARRHPWVLGRLGDWRIPMGPYTPPQLAVASIGAFLLIKTATWWAPVMGPVPVVAWGFGIWAARHSRIAGRSPFPVLLDAVSLAFSPRQGRIRGRAVREARPVWLTGGFGIEEATDEPVPAGAPNAPQPADRPARPKPAAPGARRQAPTRPGSRTDVTTRPQSRDQAPARAQQGPALTPLQQMLAAAAAAHTDTTTRQTQMGDMR